MGVGGQGGCSELTGSGDGPYLPQFCPGLTAAAPPPCCATCGQDEALSTSFGGRPPNLRLAGTLSTGSPPTRLLWGQGSIVSAVWLFLSVFAFGGRCGPGLLQSLGHPVLCPGAPALLPGTPTRTAYGLPNAPRGRQPPGSVANGSTGGVVGGSPPPQRPRRFSDGLGSAPGPGLLGHGQHPILVVLLKRGVTPP